MVKSGNGGFKLHLYSNVMTKRVRCVGILHGGRGVEHMKDIAKMIRCLTLKAFRKFESLKSSPFALTIIYELLGGLNSLIDVGARWHSGITNWIGAAG